MRCEVHCPKEGSLLAVAVVVAAVAWALAQLLPLVTALVLVILTACAAGVVVVVRLIVYGSLREVFRRHRRPVRHVALPAARQTALPAGTSLRALPAPQRPVEGVIIDARERTGRER